MSEQIAAGAHRLLADLGMTMDDIRRLDRSRRRLQDRPAPMGADASVETRHAVPMLVLVSDNPAPESAPTPSAHPSQMLRVLQGGAA